MRSIRFVSPLLLILAVSMLTPRLTRAQDTAAEDLRPLKSENHALQMSLIGTGAPIAAGAVVAVLGVSHDTYVDPYTGATQETTHRWGLGPGLAMVGAGVILGPTLGYLYVGRVGGLPIRVLLPAAGTAAAIIPAANCSGGEDCALGALAVGFGIGCGLALVDAGYDLFRLKGVVRKRNERTRQVGLRLVPLYLRSTEQPALAVQVRF